MRFEADFNNSWYFLKMDVDATKDDALKVPEEKWNKVTLPHDWLIFNTKNLYEDSTGWYRKWFGVYLNKNKSYYVNFDGIYMDSTIYVNGKKAGENHYGYSSFELDITDYLEDGENEILVRVCHFIGVRTFNLGISYYKPGISCLFCRNIHSVICYVSLFQFLIGNISEYSGS